MWQGAVSVPRPLMAVWKGAVQSQAQLWGRVGVPGALPRAGGTVAPGVQPCCRSCHPLSLPGSARKGWLGPPLPLGFGASWGAREVLRDSCKTGLVEYITLKRERKPVGKKQAAELLWLVAACFFCCGNGGITLQHPLCVCLVSWSLYLLGHSLCYR